jgi:outer membrane receptor protein involved in Fe transport
LDASISKRFRKIGLFVNFGVRNILDVRNVNVVGPSGAHANSNGTRAQANGRNLFLSLKYQINAK